MGQPVLNEHALVTFTVPGIPAPQGSKTAGRTKSGANYVREDNPKTEPWRNAVAGHALAAMAGRRQLYGPLRLTATFVFRRPAGHYGTGRNAGTLKPSSPVYVRTRPDVDKLLRAIGDAITGAICRDDSQIVVVHAEKRYGDHACARIVVEELTLEDDRSVEAAPP